MPLSLTISIALLLKLKSQSAGFPDSSLRIIFIGGNPIPPYTVRSAYKEPLLKYSLIGLYPRKLKGSTGPFFSLDIPYPCVIPPPPRETSNPVTFSLKRGCSKKFFAELSPKKSALTPTAMLIRIPSPTISFQPLLKKEDHLKAFKIFRSGGLPVDFCGLGLFCLFLLPFPIGDR